MAFCKSPTPNIIISLKTKRLTIGTVSLLVTVLSTTNASLELLLRALPSNVPGLPASVTAPQDLLVPAIIEVPRLP